MKGTCVEATVPARSRRNLSVDAAPPPPVASDAKLFEKIVRVLCYCGYLQMARRLIMVRRIGRPWFYQRRFS